MRTGTVSLMPQRRKEVIDDEVRMDHCRFYALHVRSGLSAQLMSGGLFEFNNIETFSSTEESGDSST